MLAPIQINYLMYFFYLFVSKKLRGGTSHRMLTRREQISLSRQNYNLLKLLLILLQPVPLPCSANSDLLLPQLSFFSNSRLHLHSVFALLLFLNMLIIFSLFSLLTCNSLRNKMQKKTLKSAMYRQWHYSE